VGLGRLIHADAGVRDRQAHVVPGGHAVAPLDVLVVQRDARRLDAQPAAAGHGVAGVDGEVQEYLLELTGVGVHRAGGGIERRGELDVFAEQPPQHAVHVGDHGIDVEHLGSEHLAATERQQLSGELRGPKPRVPDFLGVLASRVAGRRVVQQQLGRAQDGGEQVVEVVGDASRELPHGFHLLRLAQLLLELALRAHVAGEHEPGAAAGELERPGDEIHIEALALLRAVTDPGAHGTVVRPARQLLVEPALLLRRANVAQRELQELGLRVSVPGDGGPIHRHDAQRLEVVHEHRLGIGLEQEPVFALAVVQPLLGPLPLDRHGDLRRDELQDVLLRVAIAHARGVGLRDEHADGAIADLQWDADPVDRRRPDQLDLAAPLELRVHFRRDQQRLAGPEHVFGQSLAGLL